MRTTPSFLYRICSMDSSELDVFSFLVAALVTTLAIILSLFRLRRLLEARKPFDGVPMVPGNHWLLGHTRILTNVDNYQEAFNCIHQSSNKDGVTGLWMGFHRVISVSAVDSARTILQSSSQRNPPWLIRHYNRHFIGNYNIVTLNGREWKFHRSIVARTFNESFLRESRTSMREVADTMVHSLKGRICHPRSGQCIQIDVETTMKMITMDIFGRVAYSTDLGSCQRLTPTPLVKAFEFLMEELMDRIRSPIRPRHLLYAIPTIQNKRQRRERLVIRSFVADLLNEKRDILKEEDHDLLSHLVLAHHASLQEDQQSDNNLGRRRIEPRDVSDEAITDVLMTLLLAGHHTTSALLTFSLYLLAKHQDVQWACVEEIRSVRSIDENMEELVYCKAVLWETLRLFPPAPRTTRSLDRPVAIGEFVAPARTRVHIPIWSIHRDAKNFSQPEVFRPDRWAKPSDDDGASARWVERPESDTTGSIAAGNRRAMLAFSAGARSCVGEKFAVQEAVIVLASLLKELEFHLVPGYELRTSTRKFLLRPDGCLPLNVRLRSKQR